MNDRQIPTPPSISEQAGPTPTAAQFTTALDVLRYVNVLQRVMSTGSYLTARTPVVVATEAVQRAADLLHGPRH